MAKNRANLRRLPPPRPETAQLALEVFERLEQAIECLCSHVGTLNETNEALVEQIKVLHNTTKRTDGRLDAVEETIALLAKSDPKLALTVLHRFVELYPKRRAPDAVLGGGR